jgi:hypothetical protein
MLSFVQFITENIYLSEAVSQNTKGVMHELLVGYHLRNGKHMDSHPDSNGMSPQEVHDNLRSQMTSAEYDQISNRAKSAAVDIKKQLRGRIHKVHWTSKPGDLGRSTGIEASQKEDASDIVVTTKDPTHPSGFRHHGISLKVTDSRPSAGEVPVSNPGLESTYGGKDILDQHRAQILSKHKGLRTTTNKAARKEFMANNPKASTDIKKRNSAVLNSIAENLHSKLSAMKPKALVSHLRNILHAHPTPMEQESHVHIRHTTYGDGTHSSIIPSQEHEPILNTPKHITVERRGTAVVFSHRGVPFAKHRLKFESQSDPLSNIKGSGEVIKNKGRK